MDFPSRLHAAFHADPTETIMDFKGRFFTRGELAACADALLATLDAAGVARNASVAILVRNRPFHAAALVGLVAAPRPCAVVHVHRSEEAVAEEIARAGFAALIADESDWRGPLTAAAKAAGTVGIGLRLDGGSAVFLVPGLERLGAGPFRESTGEPSIELLSSGTTGAPKRVPVAFRTLERAVDSIQASSADGAFPPDVLTWPYSGVGGVCCLLASIVLNRYTALLEKFNVPEWVEAVKRLRPSFVSGPPAVMRMVLDAAVPPADVASIRFFVGGSAPMTPELEDELKRVYGIGVLWAYGATEFCGTVIAWSFDTYKQFGETKKGAMGRALPGITLRVTDVTTGHPVASGETGYLEARVPPVGGDDWIRTTDLAMIDDDGFVFHRGRGDGAIMRGGFKVLPETIVTALCSHPAVLDAGAVGVPDVRLGQVPIAGVELHRGAPPPTEAELLAHVKQTLGSVQVPTRIHVLDALPRTATLKVDLTALRRALEQKGTKAPLEQPSYGERVDRA